jgi:NAD(P)-dependent dehydrogenase (short-subunit alcohol dehydrogenase family)
MSQANTPTALLTHAGLEPARSLALALAQRGWNLALNDVTPLRLDKLADEAAVLGAQVSQHIGDTSKGLFARGLVEEVLDQFERIDLLVNQPIAEPRLALLDLDEWDFQRTLEANVHGPFLLTQLVGNWMRNERHAGWIVNLISTSCQPPCKAGREAFYTSQMALRALTAAAAPGLKEYNIIINGFWLGDNLPSVGVERILALLDSGSSAPSGDVFELGI